MSLWVKVRKVKKSHINFYLENDIIARLDKIHQDSNTIFDDRSSLIRYCVKMHLPIIEKEIKEKEND